MQHLSQSLPVIIDPSHERYGQSGELFIDEPVLENNGDLIIRFMDGQEELINNGRSTGISQFYTLPKSSVGEHARLTAILPQLRGRLSEIFNRIVEPANETPTPQTQAAQAAAAFAIEAALYPNLFTSQFPIDELADSI